MKTITILLNTNSFEKIKKYKTARKKYPLDLSRDNIYIAGEPIPKGKVLTSVGVSDRTATKILTAFNRDKSTVINLTLTQMRQIVENVDVRPTHGAGDVGDALSIVGGVQDLVEDNASASYPATKNKLENRLKYLQGRGSTLDPDNLTAGQKAGAKMAKHVEKTGKLPDADTIKKVVGQEMTGEGMTGDGWWSDFWDGFTWGFTNPIDAIQLLGEEIIHAAGGSLKKKEGKGIKTL